MTKFIGTAKYGDSSLRGIRTFVKEYDQRPSRSQVRMDAFESEIPDWRRDRFYGQHSRMEAALRWGNAVGISLTVKAVEVS